MNWWRRLRKNPLAKLGAVTLLLFYFMVIGADFIAPYNPYSVQENGSLLPPTTIYWRNSQRQFIGLMFILLSKVQQIYKRAIAS